ncbi:hypothetical protein Bca52824_022144 [Brassica carinata]|uniref:Uncharacterized protein n=1 Tax=Brassica carinata TaxID=52824 RepID=A0A8X8AU30_BRACI|nr:hypothetical protein Bca52824_022144 [Brassica carinata]
MNPDNQYCGYVDFLQSVSGNNVQGNFPYESFPSSLSLGASENPPFSSQQSEAPSQPENPPVSKPGMVVEDFKSVHVLKMEDLTKKERLSKLAILDTLLAKKEPSESEEAVKNKLPWDVTCDYSYSQPSEVEFGQGDSGNSSTDMYIAMDQAEIEAARSYVYPPQPEVEFGFPMECYCGGEPVLDPGRRFYTCNNRDDGECHIYKFWDVSATEEIKALGTQLTLLTDKDTELRELKELQSEQAQKLVRLERIVCALGRKNSRFGNWFEVVVGVLVVVLVIIAIGVAARR